MKYLALDIGERKVGVAGSDSGIAAVPLPDLEMGSDFMVRLGTVVEKEKPEIIVFGLPLLPSGDETDFCRNIRQLAKGIKHEFGVEIDFENEIGSTKEAEKRLREMGVAEKDLGKYDDSMAAMIILENYFLGKE
jgi:putative Holliday junction resolvase